MTATADMSTVDETVAEKPGADAAARAGAPSSTYWHYSDTSAKGRFTHTVSLGDKVNTYSQVIVSICELTSEGVPFLGSAVMSVDNVVPQADGRVLVSANVAWGSPLKVRLNYVILN
jgi:hypothetical protein